MADPAVFTTLAFVTLDATGNRAFSFARKPGADTCLRADEVDTALIDEARVFHFGSLSLTDEPARAATRAAVAHAKEAGKYISFDPNLRRPLWPGEAAAKEQIEWGLRQADIVKISDEEIASCGGFRPRKAPESCWPSTACSWFTPRWGPGAATLPTGRAAAKSRAPPASGWSIPPAPGTSLAAAR